MKRLSVADLEIHKGKLRRSREEFDIVEHPSSPSEDKRKEKENERGKKENEQGETEVEENRKAKGKEKEGSAGNGWCQRANYLEGKKGTKLNSRLKNLARMEMEISVLPKVPYPFLTEKIYFLMCVCVHTL